MWCFKKKSFDQKIAEARREYEQSNPKLVAFESEIKSLLGKHQERCRKETLDNIRKTGRSQQTRYYSCSFDVLLDGKDYDDREDKTSVLQTLCSEDRRCESVEDSYGWEVFKGWKVTVKTDD